jgi:cell division protein ZapA
VHPEKPTNSSETYEVQVAGLPLRLKSSHDAQTVQELIDLVDGKVKEALAANSNISFQKALLLASLHVAEDLVFLKRALRGRLDTLETKAKGILTELDSSPLARLTIDQ